jgi:hypothetical protein
MVSIIREHSTTANQKYHLEIVFHARSIHSMGGSVHSEYIEAWSTHRQFSRTTTRGHMESPADFGRSMQAAKTAGVQL